VSVDGAPDAVSTIGLRSLTSSAISMKDEEIKTEITFDYMQHKFIPLLVMAFCLLF
jgi:hypothetical protein